jgi:hypothetical protein
LDVSNVLPMIWAQFSTSSSPGSGPVGGAPSPTLLLALLALRRWCGSLTLSQPDPALEPISAGLWAWLLGLAALLVLAMLWQGPVRAIGQLLDMPGHARLLSAALDRFRRSGRLLAVAVGVSVVAWTANQTLSYSVATGRDDELLLIKGRRLTDVALNQGYLAALTPARDIVGLGLIIPLLVAASVALFQFSTDRWGSGVRPPFSVRRRSSRWATIGWGSTALYALYRFVSLVTGNAELPMGGCVIIEAVVLPILMALADGVVVAWVLVELRNAGLGDNERDSLDILSVTLVIPSAALACVLAYPARYIGAAAWLSLVNLPPNYATGTWVASYLRWQLGWGLIYLQGAAVVFAGLFGTVAWSRGTPGDALKGYLRMLSNEGGHLVAAVAAGGLAAGALSSAAYVIVLSLPTSTWALNAADSYAHYATLPVGLILMAALIELGERSLPTASLAGSGPDEPLA